MSEMDEIYEHPVDRERRAMLEARRRAGRSLLENCANPNLPLDADSSETRTPIYRMRDIVFKALEEVRTEKSEFYDLVADSWKTMFPDVRAKPGRCENGNIILYVASASVLYIVRSKIAMIKRKLSALPGAPRRFNVILEIHK